MSRKAILPSLCCVFLILWKKEDFFRKKSHDFLKKLLQNSQKYIII